jgi:hypothetical protein
MSCTQRTRWGTSSLHLNISHITNAVNSSYIESVLCLTPLHVDGVRTGHLQYTKKRVEITTVRRRNLVKNTELNNTVVMPYYWYCRKSTVVHWVPTDYEHLLEIQQKQNSQALSHWLKLPVRQHPVSVITQRTIVNVLTFCDHSQRFKVLARVSA